MVVAHFPPPFSSTKTKGMSAQVQYHLINSAMSEKDQNYHLLPQLNESSERSSPPLSGTSATAAAGPVNSMMLLGAWERFLQQQQQHNPNITGSQLNLSPSSLPTPSNIQLGLQNPVSTDHLFPPGNVDISNATLRFQAQQHGPSNTTSVSPQGPSQGSVTNNPNFRTSAVAAASSRSGLLGSNKNLHVSPTQSNSSVSNMFNNSAAKTIHLEQPPFHQQHSSSPPQQRHAQPFNLNLHRETPATQSSPIASQDEEKLQAILSQIASLQSAKNTQLTMSMLASHLAGRPQLNQPADVEDIIAATRVFSQQQQGVNNMISSNEYRNHSSGILQSSNNGATIAALARILAGHEVGGQIPSPVPMRSGNVDVMGAFHNLIAHHNNSIPQQRMNRQIHPVNTQNSDADSCSGSSMGGTNLSQIHTTETKAKQQKRKRSINSSGRSPKTARTRSVGSGSRSSKICQHEGCVKLARSTTSFCAGHGGGRRCKHKDCQKSARGATMFCIGHGGGRRCQHPDCAKSAQGSTFFCISHGGGRRCKYHRCHKSARGPSGFCKAHGGGRRCKALNCQKSAADNSFLCRAHGGGKRCTQVGCNKPARGLTALCSEHHKLQTAATAETSSPQETNSHPADA